MQILAQWLGVPVADAEKTITVTLVVFLVIGWVAFRPFFGNFKDHREW